MKQNILLFGAGGHSKVIIDIILQVKKYNILGYIDYTYSAGEYVNGLKVYGSNSEISAIFKNENIAGGVLCTGLNHARMNIVDEVSNEISEFKWLSVIHPNASISPDVLVGEGTVICSGVCISTGSKIGKYTILNTGSSVDHDNIIEDYASCGPGVVTGGNVNIGFMSYIGIGSIIKHNIKIGKHSVIGGGSYVNKDIGNHALGYGIPFKFIRKREWDENYL